MRLRISVGKYNFANPSEVSQEVSLVDIPSGSPHRTLCESFKEDEQLPFTEGDWELETVLNAIEDRSKRWLIDTARQKKTETIAWIRANMTVCELAKMEADRQRYARRLESIETEACALRKRIAALDAYIAEDRETVAAANEQENAR